MNKQLGYILRKPSVITAMRAPKPFPDIKTKKKLGLFCFSYDFSIQKYVAYMYSWNMYSWKKKFYFQLSKEAAKLISVTSRITSSGNHHLLQPRRQQREEGRDA